MYSKQRVQTYCVVLFFKNSKCRHFFVEANGCHSATEIVLKKIHSYSVCRIRVEPSI